VSRLTSRKTRLFLVLSAALAFALSCGPPSLAAKGPSGGNAGSTQILNERTAFRWDPEFFAWAVHYPERIVPLWVQEKKPATKSAAENLLRSYQSSLRLKDSTAVLFSVFAYNQKPIQLKPLSGRLFLRKLEGTDAGRKIPPRKTDPGFDQPFLGLKQGLVFFPKTPEPFDLVLEMPGKSPLVFTFQGDLLRGNKKSLSEKAESEKREAVEKERKKWEDQVAKLRQEIAQLKEASGGMGGSPAPGARLASTEGPGKAKPQPEHLARRFFEAWKNGDLALMQSFLSDPLRKQFPSSEALSAFLRKKALPERLPRDAALEAAGETGRFRITLTTKVLLVRDLRRFFLSVEEGGKEGFVVSKME